MDFLAMLGGAIRLYLWRFFEFLSYGVKIYKLSHLIHSFFFYKSICLDKFFASELRYLSYFFSQICFLRVVKAAPSWRLAFPVIRRVYGLDFGSADHKFFVFDPLCCLDTSGI